MRQSMNVLVVENNGAQAEFMARILQEQGWATGVIIACNGSEALDILFGAHTSLDPLSLILLDLSIPEMDGLVILKQIKNDPRTKAIPVIVLTASYLENDMNTSYRLGANGFLRKPVDLMQLTQVLRYWAGDGREARASG
ncbi:MAG: response regulator [Anaerolineae bacterium]|nr:response regulator [Anaerolineae bacterium]